MSLEVSGGGMGVGWERGAGADRMREKASSSSLFVSSKRAECPWKSMGGGMGVGWEVGEGGVGEGGGG